MPDFKFPLVKIPLMKSACEKPIKPRNFIMRFFARRVASMINENPGGFYQFGGSQGSKAPEYLLINADKYQLMHWILRTAGYLCCCAEVIERCGIKYADYEEEYRVQKKVERCHRDDATWKAHADEKLKQIIRGKQSKGCVMAPVSNEPSEEDNARAQNRRSGV